MDLFNVEYNSNSGYKKLPTLRQYLREKGKKRIPSEFLVFRIWLPNQYKSFTLTTEYFRARVYQGTPLYEALESSWDEVTKQDQAIAIVITDRESCSFSLKPSTEKGSWEFLGDIGLTWNTGT